MHILHFIYNSIGKPKLEIDPIITSDICCFCAELPGCYTTKQCIGDGFTNYDYFTNPSSSVICEKCAGVLSLRQLRISNWIAFHDHLVVLKREQIWDIIFGDSIQDFPFAMYVTTSWKKHGSFKNRFNHSADQYYIQFEETGVVFDKRKHTKLADIIDLFYSIPPEEQSKKAPKSYFTKEMIKTGNYPQNRIRQFGLRAFEQGENILQRFRFSPVFELLVYASNQKPRR